MQLAIIRHLPTAWNKLGLLQGKRDIEILEPSSSDKKKIENNFKKISEHQPFDRVLTSSLIRTQQSASVYGFSSFHKEPLLDELNFGLYEGKPKNLLIEENYNDWLNEPRNLTLGEPLVDLENRIDKFLEKYKMYSSILAFGHGSWIRAAMSLEQSGDINMMNQITVHNNDFIILEFDQKKG